MPKVRSRIPGVRRQVRAIRFEPDLWSELEAEARLRSFAMRRREFGVSEVLRQLVRERLDELAACRRTLQGSALEEAILAAFGLRERAQRGYVPIHELRQAVPARRDSFDAALLELQATGRLYLNKLNDARGVPDDQVRDGIVDPIRGQLFFVSRGEKGPGG